MSYSRSTMLHVTYAVFLVSSLTALAVSQDNNTRGRPCTVSCELESNIKSYGFDANKELLFVDEKKCVKVYRNPTGTDCGGDDVCHRDCSPRSYWLETHSNRTGPFMVKTIRKCYPTTHHCQNCQRKPSRVYVFPRSKYQKGIDVGKCSGVCGVEEEMEMLGSGIGEAVLMATAMACQPTRAHSVAAEGPNGYVTLDVVDNCSCVYQKCYRVDHFQSVSMFTNNKRYDELVNTGKCIGSCSGVYINPRCVQFSLDGRCTWYLPGTAAKCRPTTATTFSYTDLDGVNKTLPIVGECGCTTG